MSNYCTLFDSNYLTRGLALYNSLRRVSQGFRLYIYCFDTLTFQVLDKMNLENVVLVPLDDFETDLLKRVKKERTKGEYCWTCTPHIIRYSLDMFGLSEVTYLDADIYFFSDPSVLFNEFEQSKASVLITAHRYTPRYDRSTTYGIYCVQFITFKADENGLLVLQWWQERCLEWCYARCEDGKFGDQRYLDDWTTRFEGVHVLDHLGGGVAPWNIQQYDVVEGPSVNSIPVVFYHFHNILWYENDSFDLGIYKLGKQVIKFIYEPYLNDLMSQLKKVQSTNSDFNIGKMVYSWNWGMLLRAVKLKLVGAYNVIQR